MDLQRLRYFLEVARQKHFTRAAEICHISQPSLSQQIKKLESELGGRLFHRSREKVELTPLGKAFLKHASAILAEVQSAEEFVGRVQEKRLSTVRLGAIPTIAPYLAPNLLQAIRARAPSARFELLENTSLPLSEALLTGKIDFALLSPPLDIQEECDHLPVLRDELLLTLPRNHPLTKVENITHEHLINEPMLLLENSHCLAAQVGAYCREHGLTEHFDIRGSQIDTLLGLVERGFGISFTPALAAKSHSHRKVVYRSLGPHACSREIWLVWIRQQFLNRSQHTVLKAAKSLSPAVSKRA